MIYFETVIAETGSGICDEGNTDRSLVEVSTDERAETGSTSPSYVWSLDRKCHQEKLT